MLSAKKEGYHLFVKRLIERAEERRNILIKQGHFNDELESLLSNNVIIKEYYSKGESVCYKSIFNFIYEHSERVIDSLVSLEICLSSKDDIINGECNQLDNQAHLLIKEEIDIWNALLSAEDLSSATVTISQKEESAFTNNSTQEWM